MEDTLDIKVCYYDLKVRGFQTQFQKFAAVLCLGAWYCDM